MDSPDGSLYVPSDVMEPKLSGRVKPPLLRNEMKAHRIMISIVIYAIQPDFFGAGAPVFL